MSLLSGARCAGRLALRGPCRRAKTTVAAASVDGSVPLAHKARHSTELSADGRTHVTTLANGLRVASEATAGHFGAVGVYVDAGSRYEDGATAGYAHLMDRLAFRNSEGFTSAESAAVIERLGGSIMSSSSRECIMYQAAVFPHDVAAAVRLMADATLRPKFLPEDVDGLRASVPWEIQDVESKPDSFLPEKLHEVAFQTGTLGNPLLCPLPQLSAATPESLTQYHLRWYRPERMVVAAIGVDHDELVRLCGECGFADLARAADGHAAASAAPADAASSKSWLRSILGRTAGSAPRAAVSGGNHAVHTSGSNRAVYTGGAWFESKPDVDFTQVYLGFKSAGIDDEHGLYVYAVLQMLLGGGGSFSAGGPGKGMYSRLYTRVLNQHAWIESCVAFHHCYTDTGLFGISGSCRPPNERALLDVMAAEIEAVAVLGDRPAMRAASRRAYAAPEGPSQLEVRRAKNQLKSNLLMNLESRMVQLEDLGRQVQVSGRKVPAEAMVDRIEAITTSDIAKAAAALLESPATLLAQGHVDDIRHFHPKVAARHGIRL